MDAAGGAVDEARPVLELGEVFKAIGMEREVVWDVNVWEL